MGDYKKQGGAFSGRGERYDGFEGEPWNIGGALSSKDHHSDHDSHHSNYAEDIDTGKAGGASNVGGVDNIGNTGSHSFSMANKADSRVDSGMEGEGTQTLKVGIPVKALDNSVNEHLIRF